MADSTGASVFDSRFFWAYVACFALQCLALVATLVVGYFANLSGQTQGLADTNSPATSEETANAKQQAAALMAQVDTVLSDQEKLQQAYAELSRRLEEERSMRRKVEQRLAPRRIPPAQIQAILESIAG